MNCLRGLVTGCNYPLCCQPDGPCDNGTQRLERIITERLDRIERLLSPSRTAPLPPHVQPTCICRRNFSGRRCPVHGWNPPTMR